MSHKITAPGPFPGGHEFFVDQNSTSNTEDGSASNPFKTIQAALDAVPTITTPVSAIFGINIAAGLYEEHLVIPAEGAFYLASSTPGLPVFLGDVEDAIRNITWTPEDLDGAVPLWELHLTNIAVTGAINLSTVDGVVDARVVVTNSWVFGGIQTAVGIIDSDKLHVDVFGSDVGASDIDGVVTAQRSTRFDGNLSCSKFGRVWDTSILGELAVASTSLEMARCSVTGDTIFTGSIANLKDTVFHGLLTVGGEHVLADCSVDGNAVLTDCQSIRNSLIGGTTLFDGGTPPVIYNSAFTGLVTSTALPIRRAHASDFFGGVTVAAIPEVGFFSCRVAGNFTGPALSFRVDTATAGMSSDVTLAGGATINLVTYGSSNGLIERLEFPQSDDLLIDWQPAVDGFSPGALEYIGSPEVYTVKRNGRDTYLFPVSGTYINCGVAYGKPASFSIAAVFRLTLADTTRGICGAIFSSTSATTWGVLNSNVLKLQVGFGDGTNYRLVNTADDILAANTWYCAVVSYTTGSANPVIYLNGVARGIGTTEGTATTAHQGAGAIGDFRIGRGSVASFPGYVASCQAWGVPLTPEEVAEVSATLMAAYDID